MDRERQDPKQNGGQDLGIPWLTMDAASARFPMSGQPEPAKPEEKMSLFWRVFGGTLLSIAALVCVTVYNQFNSSLADVRRDIHQLQDARADLVRKDEFNSRMGTLWTSIKDLQTVNTALTALNERYKVLDQQLEKQLKTTAEEHRDLQRKLDEQRKLAEDERKGLQQKLEEERRELQRQLEAARKGTDDIARKVDERLKLFLDERKEASQKLEEQMRQLTEEARECNRKVQALGERLATIEGRQGSNKTAQAEQ